MPEYTSFQDKDEGNAPNADQMSFSIGEPGRRNFNPFKSSGFFISF